MLDLVQIDQLQHHGPDLDQDHRRGIDDLSAAEIDDQMRACEAWYARHEASFIGFKRQYLAVSFKSWLGPDQLEMRNIVISPSELEVSREFERRFGKFGGYVRRIGDPIIDF
jgi:hypothetical protein